MDLLIWPHLTIWDGLAAIMVVIGGYIFFRLLSRSYTRRVYFRKIWYDLYEKAISRGLNQKEIAILESFFHSISPDSREKLSQDSFQQGFKKALFKDLVYHPAPVATLVKVLEKLFSKNQAAHLTVLSELEVGENCGLKLANRYYLAIVVSLQSGQIVLSVPALKKKQEYQKTTAFLFAYRTQFGSFQIKGQIEKKSGEDVNFSSEAKFTPQMDEFLMAIWELPVTIRPVSTAKWKSEEETLFHGTSEKVSQRGVLIHLQETALKPDTVRQDFWEITFPLQTGELIVATGRLILSEIRSEAYIFRFTELQEPLARTLREQILRSDPIKENLS